jgi:transposase
VSNFINPALKQLTDQQMRFAPPSRRLEQLSRARKLLSEIDPVRQYPYQFVCFRITDFRPDTYPNLLIPGAELQHDLALFIEVLSQSIAQLSMVELRRMLGELADSPAEVKSIAQQSMAELSRSLPALPVEAVPEPVMTLDQISKHLNVSTKTINRWRRKGLIGVPVLCNGRKQLGFLPSLVEPFLKANQERVEKSARFSQLSECEKDDILRRAKRLARVGTGTLTEISRRIARRLGRSIETVRYTIKNFDREHPEQALFPSMTGPLDATTRQLIYNSLEFHLSCHQRKAGGTAAGPTAGVHPARVLR